MDISSMPVSVTAGKIPISLPIAFSWMPKDFGIDGPVISASRIATFLPARLSATAS